MRSIDLYHGVASHGVTIDADQHIHFRSVNNDYGVVIDMDLDPATAAWSVQAVG